jgi:hypothetical protein
MCKKYKDKKLIIIIKMITCNLMGGLGNQLFQIFATIAYASKSRNRFLFLNQETLGGGGCTLRYTFWNTFLSSLKPFLTNNLPFLNMIRETNFTYNELPVESMIGTNTMIHGYFQSYKYFQEHFETICKLIGLEKKKQEVLNKLGLNKKDLNNTISMHFRLGDYKKLSDFHPIAPQKYYANALHYFNTINPGIQYKIIYFCEDEDLEEVLKTIEYLKNLQTDYTFERGDNTLADWEQMLYMSLCSHNIIANSSFSWWGAYFNTNKDINNERIVLYPEKWFGPTANIDTKDLCPLDWVKINY